MPVSEYEEALLRLIQSRSLTIEDIIDEFEGVFKPSDVKKLIRALLGRKYIKLEKHLAAGVYSLYSDVDDAKYDDDYVLTPLGKSYLASTTSNFTSFSNISNSNIANQSTNIKQEIDTSGLPEDVQEKLDELSEAVQARDKSAIKKAFSYIADKSVDVAIAVLVGGLNK